MIITLGEEEVEIAYVSIQQYETLMENPEIDDIDFISLMTKLPITDLRDAPYDQIKFVASYIRAWLNELQNPQLDLEIIYEGERLGLIMPTEMSYGEYADLHTIVSSKPVDMRLASAILYRPIIKGKGEDRKIVKYDYDECKERSKTFDAFPMSAYLASLFFLTKFKQIQLDNSPLYLESKQRMELINQKMKGQTEKN